MLKKLLKEKSNNIGIQLFRYTIVGGIAFLGDFATLFCITEFLNVYYLVSAGIAFLVGLSINYSLSIKWVFSERKLNSSFLEFIIFMSIGLAGLILNEVFMWILTDKLGFYYLVSKIGTTAIVYLWNFTVRRFALFNKEIHE